MLTVLSFLEGYLFGLIGELNFSSSVNASIFMPVANIVSGPYGFAKPHEACGRVLDQRELTTEILSL